MAKDDKIGQALVFLRRDGAPLPPGCAGHVGWGFAIDDGAYQFGATENDSKEPFIPKHGDNGSWYQRGSLEAALTAMRQRNYDAYKLATFRKPNVQAAKEEAAETMYGGYLAITNNCLDHVYRILKAYGQPDLPWRRNHPSPNDWFALYNGEFHNL